MKRKVTEQKLYGQFKKPLVSDNQRRSIKKQKNNSTSALAKENLISFSNTIKNDTEINIRIKEDTKIKINSIEKSENEEFGPVLELNCTKHVSCLDIGKLGEHAAVDLEKEDKINDISVKELKRTLALDKSSIKTIYINEFKSSGELDIEDLKTQPVLIIDVLEKSLILDSTNISKIFINKIKQNSGALSICEMKHLKKVCILDKEINLKNYNNYIDCDEDMNVEQFKDKDKKNEYILITRNSDCNSSKTKK